MKNLTAIICLTLIIFIVSAGMSWSADLEKGYAAYESGDYAKALRLFRSLSEKGNAGAQTMLGWFYVFGIEMPIDRKYGYMLGEISKPNGDKHGASVMANAAEKMTSADISPAQKLARECVRKNHKGC